MFDDVPPMLLAVLGAVAAGGLVGFEREMRGRPAGFRTHILVCLASALLMLAATNQAAWLFAGIADENIVTDPTRMAHGVLTGIGFLCAGVIFREGFSIHGLTTAASLWITAVLGILFGVGMWGLAAGGAAVTILVLVALRIVDDRLPSRVLIDVVVRYARAEALTAAELRSAVEELGLTASMVSHRLREEGRVVEQAMKLRARDRRSSELLAARLASLPQVLEFEVAPRDD